MHAHATLVTIGLSIKAGNGERHAKKMGGQGTARGEGITIDCDRFVLLEARAVVWCPGVLICHEASGGRPSATKVVERGGLRALRDESGKPEVHAR